tara:strand:- start:622 stop:1491 length:870 start_codon:yes stop_codon:yes gene_type:complete
MKKVAIALCVLLSLITGCHKNEDHDEWKQAYEEKKFESEMTAKAKEFIEWYYEAAEQALDVGDDVKVTDRYQLNFIRLGKENKNYAVFSFLMFDEEGVLDDHNYTAIDLTNWDSSIPFSPEIEGSEAFKNITLFGGLIRTEDGMGFTCGGDCFSHGPNAEIHEGLIFEEAAPTSKDLEKIAAFKEALKLNRASKAISSLYGLSEERSFQLSKTILSWKKVSNQRAMTKRDLDHLTVEFAGVKVSEIVESFKDLAQGDEARFNNLIERAAEVNEISPEAVKTMIQDAFMR